jgi:hypothetical protein
MYIDLRVFKLQVSIHDAVPGLCAHQRSSPRVSEKKVEVYLIIRSARNSGNPTFPWSTSCPPSSTTMPTGGTILPMHTTGKSNRPNGDYWC